MSAGRYVVLYTSDVDPVAQALASIERVQCIHVDELTPHIERGDEMAPLRANFPPDVMGAFRGAHVLNRNFSYDNSRLAMALAHWGLNTLWVDSLLTTLVSTGAARFHDTSIRGVSRSLLPLNSQWFLLAKQELKGVSFPRFVYGFGKVQPPLDGFEDPLQKSVWSLFDWKSESTLSEAEASWHKFFVDRPKGAPVVVTFVGRSVGFIFPRGEVELDSKVKQRYAALVKAAGEQFQSRMGEMLTYLQPDGMIVFCAFTPLMETSGRCGWFEDFLITGLGLDLPLSRGARHKPDSLRRRRVPAPRAGAAV